MSFPAQTPQAPTRPAVPAYPGSYHAAGRPAARPGGYGSGHAGRGTAAGAGAAGTAATTAAPYATQAARYREAELASATPGQLVVMLFDKLLLTVRRARVAMEGGAVEERSGQILRAHDMLTELRVSLDFEAGGELARQLDALYDFALRELLEANRTRSVAKLDAVARICGELRDGFAGAVAQLQGPAAAPSPASLAARTA